MTLDCYFAKHRLQFEDLGPAQTPQAAAKAANLPLAYFAETALATVGNRTMALVHGADRSLDPAAMAAAIGSEPVAILSPEQAERAAGLPAAVIGPAALMGKIETVFDERCLRLPTLCMPTADGSRIARVETRHLRRLGLHRARLTAPPPAPTSAYDVLLERGFLERVSDEDRARRHFADPRIRGYIGFDPTADSLHVGSLLPIMALAHLQQSGLGAVALVGGATGLIGDPSGKTELRRMLTREDIAANMRGIAKQLATYLQLDGKRGHIVNNADWFEPAGCLDFLRELGPMFPVRSMLNRECFRSRMEREGEGLTFLELAYMLLQAYDFVHLAGTLNCLVQLGGNDQWGNICAGIELGRRAQGRSLFGRPVSHGGELAGVTFTLLTKASGGKFGKSESGNVWLDEARTSVFDFFQFWRTTDDADVERFLGIFTFIPLDEITRLCAEHAGAELNAAKEILAFAATALAHGPAKAAAAAADARGLFGGYTDSFLENAIKLGLASPEELEPLSHEAAGHGLKRMPVASADLAAGKVGIVDALVGLGLTSSRGEARRLVKGGGAYLADQRVENPEMKIPAAPAGSSITVRAGKKKYGLLDVTQ